MHLHVRGRTLPDEAEIELWVVDGRISAEPVAGADTVFDGASGGGWILPGLVDAHCHVGLGPHGEIPLDEAIAQAETERDVGALLLRDCGSPTDTRSLDDHDDLPRIIRAGRHLARPKRYIAGFAEEFHDEWQLPAAAAEQARRGDGWVKLVGDWIDRSVGDLAPLWSDDVLKAAIAAAHANGARVTAHYAGKVQAQEVLSQASFYSANDLRLHFGLGAAEKANLDIRWPNGATERIQNVPAGRIITIREGSGIIKSELFSKSAS